MLNIYKSIGIEKIVEDEGLFEKLNQSIMDNVRYVIPGYACDYYLHTFPVKLSLNSVGLLTAPSLEQTFISVEKIRCS